MAKAKTQKVKVKGDGLIEPRRCGTCNAKNPVAALFCRKCGARLDVGEPAAASTIEPTRPATPFQRWAPPISVFLAAIAVYVPSLDNGFVSWDDDHYIYDNRQLTHPKGLRDIWTNTKYTEYKDQGLKDSTHQYYPLLFTVFWIEHRLFGDDASVFKQDVEARGFHATNMLLHAVNGVVLLLLLHRLGVGVWPAWLVAALFAIHPMHVASVAWTAEGKNLLALLFYMLAMMSYLRFRRRGGWGFYLATFLLFQCALWSKTVALTFPVVLLLTDYLLDREYRLDRLALRALFMLVVIGLAYVPTQHIEKAAADGTIQAGWKLWHSLLLTMPVALAGFLAVWLDRHLGRRLPRETIGELLRLFVVCLVALLPTLLLRERWSPVNTAVRFLPAILWMAVVLVIDRVAGGRLNLASVVRIAPLVLMSVLAADTTSHMEDRNRRVPLVNHQRPFVAAASIWFYPVKLLVPIKQLPIYNLWNPDPIHEARWEPVHDPKWWAPLLGVIVGGAALFHWRRKITAHLGPHFWWGLGFYLVTQFPMMGLKNINFFQFAYVADHYIYNGCAGVFLMFAVVLDALRRKAATMKLEPPWVTGVVCAALAAYGVKTYRYTDVWQNSESFWTTTLAGNPGCWAGWFNLGNQYKRESDKAARAGDDAKADALVTKAAEHYRRAIEAKPNLHQAYNVLGHLLLRLGRKQELDRFCDQEMEINPNIASPYYFKALLREGEEDWAAAVDLFKKALARRLDEDLADDAGVRAGTCLMKLQEYNEAVPFFELAAKRRPRKYEVRMNLGMCYLKENQLDKAEAQFQEALNLRANDPKAQGYLDEVRRRKQGG